MLCQVFNIEVPSISYRSLAPHHKVLQDQCHILTLSQHTYTVLSAVVLGLTATEPGEQIPPRFPNHCAI